MYGSKTLEEVTLNLHAGPLQLAATSLILVSPFTKFALTLEPVARGTEQFLQKVSSLLHHACLHSHMQPMHSMTCQMHSASDTFLCCKQKLQVNGSCHRQGRSQSYWCWQDVLIGFFNWAPALVTSPISQYLNRSCCVTMPQVTLTNLPIERQAIRD